MDGGNDDKWQFRKISIKINHLFDIDYAINDRGREQWSNGKERRDYIAYGFGI